ncbi:MAG TPA: hypothetical protein VER58_16365 [Thermoanaerobaculia bacterium]|nr:hypothetical protein [Thermoanaerobaculia bacterium]
MSRILTFTALALLLAFPAIAATPCNLTMSINCVNGTCTGVTTNNGTGVCSGEFIGGIFVDVASGQASVSNFRTTPAFANQQCFDSSSLPVGLPFALCIGDSSLAPGGSFTMTGNVAPLAGAPTPLPIIAVTEVINSTTGDELGFAYAETGVTVATCTPIANVPAVTLSGSIYIVSWSPVSDPNSSFTVDESTAADFSANFASRNVSGFSTQFSHSVTTTTTYYYRVRANSCSGSPGPNSGTVSIVVQALAPQAGRSTDGVAPAGSTAPISYLVHLDQPPGSGKQALDIPFTAAVDKPYLSVSPASGTIPAGGTNVTITANPTNLPPGANTGTLTVQSNGSTISTKSVTISLVTPVGPGTKTIPPSNALIIPVVAHLQGARGPFQSDVRLTNTSSASVQYQVTYTPIRTDGTKTSKTTAVTADAGQTIALNDIVKDFFGIGATDVPGDAGAGALEIRPLNTGSILNYASSRTFTFNDKGTFGQFIAAIPFNQFATKASVVPLPGVPAPTGNPVLSMQQIASSSKFSTNLGIVEGSGNPASGTIRILDDRGTLVRMVPYSLQPGELQQNNIAAYDVGNLDDGRIEVTVESATGSVSAYASVLDKITNDPLAVTPVQVSQISASRYVLPGMAALTNAATNFHSDIRIYNGSSTQAAVVNATFYPQSSGTPKTFGPFSIEPGGVRAFDDAVVSMFNANGQGGSIVLTTNGNSQMVATGRTYTIDSQGGTFGQFIPGVSPAQGIAAGDRPLQILQLEESTNFRSNLGLAELSGNTAHVRITAYVPDSKVSASTELDLAANEFRQLGRVLSSFNLGSNIYNARISVEVTGGSGRIASYGSVIDNFSTDPTYVPAQ